MRSALPFVRYFLLTALGAAAACGESTTASVSISLSPPSAELEVGDSEQFTATVTGSENTDVVWFANVTGVVTISPTGLVTAVGPGEVMITAESVADPDKSATAVITVTQNAPFLTSGVPVTGLSGAGQSNTYFRINVPAGTSELTVATTAASGDADLYVNHGTEPTRSFDDCDSESGSSDEICTITSPAAGEWHVLVYGYTSYTNLSIVAVLDGETAPPESGFTIENSSSTASVVQGASTSLTVTATRTGDFAGSIDLSVTGLPSGVTGTFSPSTLSPTQTSSTLTLTASETATTGASTITVRANADGEDERTASTSLTVNPAGGASVNVVLNTSNLMIGRGQHTWVFAQVTGNGYSGNGSLAIEGLPAGVTVDYNGGPEVPGDATGFFYTGEAPVRVRLTVSAGASLGATTATVRATPTNTTIATGTASLALTIVDPLAATNPTWTSLVMGSGGGCGLRADQQAYCWGGGHKGDFNTGFAVYVPIVIAGEHDFVSIAQSFTHGCGVDPAGAAWCWGANSMGAMGDGLSESTSHRVPNAVVGGLTFATIDVGADRSCALTPEGKAYCWGSQLSGGLGDGVIGQTNAAQKNAPTEVLGGLTFASLSVGRSHSCALTPDGEAYCWGINYGGQLGDGTDQDRAEPVAVLGGLTFSQISAGDAHTCGVTTSGEGYCWGVYNVVGDASAPTVDITAPRPIAGGHTFANISAGYGHSCGVTTSGNGYCWGDNFYGQLGNGASGSFERSLDPALVSGGHDFVRITAKLYMSCGYTPENRMLCWGRNHNGGLGDGTDTDSPIPVTVKTF